MAVSSEAPGGQPGQRTSTECSTRHTDMLSARKEGRREHGPGEERRLCKDYRLPDSCTTAHQGTAFHPEGMMACVCHKSSQGHLGL